MELLFVVPCIFDKEANQSAKKKEKKEKEKKSCVGNEATLYRHL